MTTIEQPGAQIGTQVIVENANVGVPFEQYILGLAEREKEIRQLLVDVALSDRDKMELNQQLSRVEQLRLDERTSYEAHASDLQERIKRLDQLSGQVPDKLIEEAKQALAKGDNAKAGQLFTQVEEQADPHIAAAAEAAYQLGKLAEDAIKYNEAIQHFERATQLTPDNPLYLEAAGSMAGTLANHQKEIEWEEKALAIYLDQNGAESVDVARLRNNLGSAWDFLGQYGKAIEYYELALVTVEKVLGVDHPSTKTVASNLTRARAAR
jgi:tetratricopeptide (TPR) repeat protein